MSVASVTTQIVAVIGGLGVGSILGQYVGTSKDRREARAGALGALAEVEAARWAGGDLNVTSGDFRASMRKFQTAALIAQLPRDTAWEYGVLAQAARWQSEANLERTGDPELGGSIERNFAEAIREAARAVAVVAWTWWPMHVWRWNRAKKRIRQLLSNLEPEEAEALNRARRHGPL
jgi:hypothetical protein